MFCQWAKLERDHQVQPPTNHSEDPFLTSELGYCVSSLYNGSTMNIHKTTNGGLSWTDQSSGYTGTRFMDIFILDEQTAFMSGNDGLIIKTTNGGNKWVTKPTGTKEQLWGSAFPGSEYWFCLRSLRHDIKNRRWRRELGKHSNGHQ
jgi:hypothetical protein